MLTVLLHPLHLSPWRFLYLEPHIDYLHSLAGVHQADIMNSFFFSSATSKQKSETEDEDEAGIILLLHLLLPGYDLDEEENVSLTVIETLVVKRSFTSRINRLDFTSREECKAKGDKPLE